MRQLEQASRSLLFRYTVVLTNEGTKKNTETGWVKKHYREPVACGEINNRMLFGLGTTGK